MDSPPNDDDDDDEPVPSCKDEEGWRESTGNGLRSR